MPLVLRSVATWHQNGQLPKIELFVQYGCNKTKTARICDSEQGGVRPAVIVQNNIGNKYSPTTIVVPVTSRQTKAHIPTHVRVKGACLTKKSLALTEQVATIDKRRIIRKMGNIKLKSLFKIGTALMIGLGLNNNTFKKGSHK